MPATRPGWPRSLFCAMTTSDMPDIAADEAAPGGGAAAGQVVLLSLAVCEAIALQAIADPAQRSGAVLQARRLRARAGEALAESSRAYLRARAELELTAGGGYVSTARELAGGGDVSNGRTTGRDATLRRSLIDAADSLIALAEAAADASVLASGLVSAVEPSRRPDVAGAAELALGAARGLRHLVEVNLAVSRGDRRRKQVVDLITAAEQAAAAARCALEQD